MTRRKLKRLRRLFNAYRRLYRLPSGVAPFERYRNGERILWLRLACDAEDYRRLPDFTLSGSIRVRFLARCKDDLRQRVAAASEPQW